MNPPKPASSHHVFVTRPIAEAALRRLAQFARVDLWDDDLPPPHEELCARLMVAAELHSTTALKACLQELRRLDPEAQRLADQIRKLMRSYDMDGIQRLLAGVVVSAADGQKMN